MVPIAELGKYTFKIESRTRVPCVDLFVMEWPLKSGPNVLFLMASPNLERIAAELKWQKEKQAINNVFEDDGHAYKWLIRMAQLID
jgi:hypothetical protein